MILFNIITMIITIYQAEVNIRFRLNEGFGKRTFECHETKILKAILLLSCVCVCVCVSKKTEIQATPIEILGLLSEPKCDFITN